VTGLLLDSHVLLWAMRQPERLSLRARQLMLSEHSSVLHFSYVSLWETAGKNSIGKLVLPDDWAQQIQPRNLSWFLG